MAYLHARGLSRCRFAALRFHPALRYREGATVRHFPALVAAVTGSDGAITGVQRTWLDPRSPAKAGVANPFRIGQDQHREQAIARYREDLWRRIRSGEVSLVPPPRHDKGSDAGAHGPANLPCGPQAWRLHGRHPCGPQERVKGGLEEVNGEGSREIDPIRSATIVINSNRQETRSWHSD